MDINAESLRQIRAEMELSQKKFAEFLGISARSYQNYEAGAKIPEAKKILILSKLNVKTAYNHNLEELTVLDPKEIFQTKAGSTYEELGDGKYLLTVPLIPVKAQARYVSEFSDADYISEMTKVSFIVDRVGNGKYQAFEIKNDSMNDGSIKSIPDGSIVLGRELGRQHWRDKLKINGFPYWIIVHKETVLCKEITAHDVENGVITCHSLNSSPEYQDFKIKLDDCHQLFNIVKKQI